MQGILPIFCKGRKSRYFCERDEFSVYLQGEGGFSVFLQLEKEFSVFLQREEDFAAFLQREGGILGVFAKREILSIFFRGGQPRDCFRMGGMLDSFVEMIDKDGTVKFSISFERGRLDILAKGCDSLDF